MTAKFASALSEHPLATQAIGEVVGAVLDELGPEPDVVVMFVTGPHVGVLEDMASAVRTLLAPRAFVGTTAVSIIGGCREVEQSPAVSLWAARLPSTTTVRLSASPSTEGWLVHGAEALPRSGTLILLADPFTFPVDEVLRSLRSSHPDLQIIGGLASAATQRGGNRLVIDDDLHDDGAVGLLLDGESTAVVVSQGCRPIGDPLIVTRSERSVIYELGGRPALDRLEELVAGADEHERSLMARGLHAGIVVDERKADFARGDFLIRNVVGGNRSEGAVAIGDEVDVGSTVQFQVRDAASADEDLRELMAGRRAAGALIFTCNGRGTHLFGEPDHDAAIVHEATDGAATAGMFCAGEIGPIGDQNHLHGFTASILLLDPVDDEATRQART